MGIDGILGLDGLVSLSLPLRKYGNRGPHPPCRVGAFFILLPVTALCPMGIYGILGLDGLVSLSPLTVRKYENRGPHPPWRVGAFFILLPVHALCPMGIDSGP